MLLKLPLGLIILRFILGPVIITAYLLDAKPVWYMTILTLGFGSDVLDGIIARRLRVATGALRSLDSWADTSFYVCVFTVAMAQYSELVAQYWIPLALLIALEVVRHIFDQIKFKKSASYHMWSAKLWGLFLYLAFLQLLGFGEAGVVFLLAIIIGIIADIEGLIASIILSEWKADVPTVLHAYRIEKGRMRVKTKE